MVYTQKQIKIIQKKRPDLNFHRIPTLDDLILGFLRKYDIIVKPIKKDLGFKGNNYNSGLSIDNNSKNLDEIKKINANEIKEWQFWKKWALDHSDFEQYRIDKIKENQLFNKDILDKLNSDEVKEEFNEILKKTNTIKFNRFIFFGWIIISLLFFVNLINMIYYQNSNDQINLRSINNIENNFLK